MSKDSIWRHKRDHLGAAAARGVRKADENHGVKLLEDLDDLVITARRILREAEADGHSKTALMAIKETRASIVAIAQISHAIWEQQNRDQQTIIVQEQTDSQSEIIREGLKNLTPEERKHYRQLNMKMIEGLGGRFESEPDPASVLKPRMRRTKY